MEGNWDSFSLFGHGRGGHAVLSSMMMCGVVGFDELGPDGGLSEGGCRAGERGRWCKLSAHPEWPVVGFGDIRARDLFLFTCASSLLPGDLYASSVSAVLSALEGHPRSVLANVELLGVGAWMAPAVRGLVEAGVGPGAATDLLNACHHAEPPREVFVLFGDPAGPTAAPHPVAQDGAVRLSLPTRLAPLETSRLRRAKVMGLGARPSGAHLALGEHAALLAFERPWVGELRLEDRTGAWERALRVLQATGGALPRAARLERAIERRFGRALAADEAFQARLQGLTELRTLLQRQVDLGLLGCEQARASGVWFDALAARLQLCEACLDRWERSVAGLFLRHLFLGNIHRLLLDGFLRKETIGAATCRCCASPVAISRYASPLGDAPDQLKADCPLCGSLQAGRVEGSALEADFVPSGLPGAPVVLRLRVVEPSPPREHLTRGWLAVHAFNEQLDGGALRIVMAAGEPAFHLPFEVPERAAPKLHTVQAILVRDMEVCVQRFLWPVHHPQGPGATS
ncbi:MAG: hypothetical protein ABIO70_32280 [Pseudomonadota bacterium]